MSSDPYNPAIINSSTIQIGYRRVNLEDTGCISDAAQLTSYWSTLDRRNFPLNQIARSLAAIDWQSYVKTRVLNVLPLTIHVIRMVDAINSCKSIRGAEGRINKVEEKLSVVVKNVNTTDYHKYIEDLLATVISGTDEFRIAYSLETLNHSFEFTNVKATFPDFRIGTSTIRLVEAKSRLNRTYTGDFRLTRERFSKIEEILPLISRDAYTVFERASNHVDI